MSGIKIDSAELRKVSHEASQLLKAMCNERRLVVLCHLNEGEKSVGELQQEIGCSQSALSQHLARLRRDRIVKTRRNGQTIYYSLAGTHAKRILAALHKLFCSNSK